MGTKRKIHLIDQTCMIAGVGLAVATVLGFLGRLFWVFDLFSHFRVQYFQLCLVLIGIAIWRLHNRGSRAEHASRLRRMVALILLACLNYAFVLPLYFGKPPVATEQPVRAMLLNLSAANGNTEEVLRVVKAADPDLLVLEEVTPKWAAELRVLDYSYRVADVREEDCFGIMILSKHPLSRTNVVFVGTAGVPSIVADVHLPQGEISLIGTHPLPPFNGEYSKHRNNQLAALPEVVLQQKNPVLLIGDLNVSPWSVHFAQLLKESGLKNSMKHFGFQPSWPSGNRFLRIPIDHMLHSPEILIHRRVVGSDVGSDHLPVIIDFTMKQSGVRR